VKRIVQIAGALLSITAFVVNAQTTTSADPIELFAKLMPVFSHPRCVNCHGGVNPYDVDGSTPSADIDKTIKLKMHFEPGLVAHGGGATSASDDCGDCHTSANNWKLAPTQLRFTGKTTKQLCEMQSVAAQVDQGAYVRHLSADPLIGLAFAGFRGGTSGHADRPGMNRDDFVQGAAEWLTNGKAKCRGWAGYITQTETFATNHGFPIQVGIGPSSVTVAESAKRDLRLDRNDGQVTVKVEQGGQRTVTQLVRDITPNGPCEYTVTANSGWIGLNSSPLGGGINIDLKPDGSYAIQFILSAETTKSDSNTKMVSNCGPKPPIDSQDAPIELEWRPWKFTIQCPPAILPDVARGEAIDCDAFDPKTNPILKGTLTRVIVNHTDAADRRSWFIRSPVAIGRSDTGEALPVTVVTTWNFKIEE
jgi:hypothetical protein